MPSAKANGINAMGGVASGLAGTATAAVAAGRSPMNNRYRIPIPLEPLKDSYFMDPVERTFLEAAERGDRHTMVRCLHRSSRNQAVNVNCTDCLGRSAIQIAVDNENVEIVELLLQQENVNIGDALLYAIREGVYKIVEMLINHPSITPTMLANDWAKSRPAGEESSDYSPDISPIILAAHCNQFEILQLLLSRGAVIEKPHSLSCRCLRCLEGMHNDSLRYSLKRIYTYRALASPAWMSLTSEDPILTAFKLSWELERLAKVENEFKEIYLELSEQCKKYSCDLLDQCRSSDEVIAVLNKRSDCDYDDDTMVGDEVESSHVAGEKLKLYRVKLALKCDQKQFVAHPNCQQLLTSIWYEGLPVWRRRSAIVKVLLCCGVICAMPFIAVYYLLFPHTRLGQLLRSPFMKFLYHSTSFGCFLVLLVLASTRTENSELSRQNVRGPPPSFVEWLIFFWVTGMVWSECKQLWDEGATAYIRQWWNWLDFIMLSLYLATFSLRAVAYFQIRSCQYGPGEMERGDWPPNDPTIISEGVFAVANVFSFARIIYLFQTNPHLGPLQISLGCMIIDIAKFFFIFFLVLTSFACGLNQLYWHYDGECPPHDDNSSSVATDCAGRTEAFMTIDASYTSLLWSLFGVIPLKDLNGRNDQAFIKWIGHALLGAYLIMAMTVMINMLIAMMSRSFQDIEDHADREWKFARSKLWMGYFDDGSTLPAPFNIIVSPKAVANFLSYCLKLLMQLCYTRGRSHSIHRANNESKAHNGNTFCINKRKASDYQVVMKRLVSRYIHQIKTQLRQDGVNEDDLLEIKQDISSLRYELREDRRHESIRWSGHIESVKRDILRAVKASPQDVVAAGPDEAARPPEGSVSQQDLTSSLSCMPPAAMFRSSSGSLLTVTPHYQHPLQGYPYKYSPQMGSRELINGFELEALRTEIVDSLRHELREMVRELVLSRTWTQTPLQTQPQLQGLQQQQPIKEQQQQQQQQQLNVHVPPSMSSSNLYQTHLFTEL